MTADPTIVIAGRAWPVPLLAVRQLRIVIPGIVGLGTAPARHYDALCDIVFTALTRAHPGLARDAFDDMPIPAWEMVDAVAVIGRQTGMLRSKPARTGKTPELPDWDAVIAEFCNFLGWTWDYCEDALTWPRIEAMYEQWRKHPPAAVLAAGRWGYKPRPRDEEALEQLLAIFPDGNLRCGATIH